jgi:ribosomal protein L40E
MSAILIAILAVAAISLAVSPLFQLDQVPARATAAIDPHVENLLSAREATYAAIKDLETDHAMGKLSDADYQNLRAKYEGKALTILRQLDATQVASRERVGHRAAMSSESCMQCGAKLATGAKFCRVCGSELPRSAAVASLASACASCGAPIAAGTKFCRQCGTPVATLQPV